MRPRVIREGTVAEPVDVTTIEVCPCGARYISGATRDRVIFTTWATVHEAHGFQWGRA